MAVVKEHTPSVVIGGNERRMAVESFETVIGLKCLPCPDAILDSNGRVTQVTTSLQGLDGETVQVTYSRDPDRRQASSALITVNGITAAYRVGSSGSDVMRKISVDHTQPFKLSSALPRRGFFGEPLGVAGDDQQGLIARDYMPVIDNGLIREGWQQQDHGSPLTIALHPVRAKDLADFLQDPKRHLDLLGIILEPLNEAERIAMGNRAPRAFVY
jgi:hypothetical protein